MSEVGRAAPARASSRLPPSAARAQPAYVLHAYDWSESSLILDLYTREEGRVVVVAKGAKRPYSQLRAVLLPFQCLSVQLSRSKTGGDAQDDVRTLKSAEWAGGAGGAGRAGGVAGSGGVGAAPGIAAAAVLPSSALLSAYYVNELLMKFLPRGAAQPELFAHYQGTLGAMALPLSGAADDSLGAVQAELPATLRAFELLLLQELGLLPDLAQDAVKAEVLRADQPYTWKPEWGLVQAGPQDEALSGREWIHLQAALIGGHAGALRQACQAAKSPLRGLLRAALAYHLAGAPLRTRELMQSLRRLGAFATIGASS